MQQEHIDSLTAVAEKIGELEQRHNDIVDNAALAEERLREIRKDIHHEADVLRAHLDSLREDIHTRLTKSKRAPVILSLLGQQEELAPLKNRIDKQSYEFYVDKEWFVQQWD